MSLEYTINTGRKSARELTARERASIRSAFSTNLEEKDIPGLQDLPDRSGLAFSLEGIPETQREAVRHTLKVVLTRFPIFLETSDPAWPDHGDMSYETAVEDSEPIEYTENEIPPDETKIEERAST